MTIASGTRLGPYEIISTIGAGGMGDVYKARDTRLDRTVAIKIVRTDFSERFEREAKSISALNHPNICTLHDVGRVRPDGASAGQGEEVSFLVMEFVDGAPIAGPLPLADVLRYGIQICDALEAAHKKSIVHRDLKPGNILATKSGIKLLDFGLAKLQRGTTGPPGNEATVAALTGAHTIVGTPQYMAPEQIEGHDADARTDIFALGCVLYELITGKRAFEGKTSSNIMAAILATEPRKISELAPVTPPTLEWVVARCLEKDPDARWQNARDVALQLKWIADHPAEAATASAGGNRTSRSGLLIGLAAGIAITAAGMWFWISSSSPGSTQATAPAPLGLSVVLPPGVSLLNSGNQRDIALSPDGRTIAFAGLTTSGPVIFLRSLDGFDALKIRGTEGGLGPFFSPNGQWIGFMSDGVLKKIPIGGGAAVTICDAPGLRGSVWLADDTIVLSPSPTGPLMRVSAQEGSAPTALTKLDAAQGEKTHRTLIGLPGGKAVVFIIGSNEIGTYDDARIVALTLETGRVTELVKGYAPMYSPTGHLLYVRQGSVFAVPFDAATLKTGGSPVQVLKDIATQPNYGTATFDIAPTGALIYAPGGDQTERDALRFVDRNGKITASGAAEGHYFQMDMSHDGKRLTLGIGGANNVQWTYDIARNQWSRLTVRLDVEQGVWTHNDSGVTYWSGVDLRTIAADGSRSEQVLVSAEQAAGRSIFPESWSGDGQMLSVGVYTPGKGYDIWLYSARDKKLKPIVETRFDEFGGRLSPDGKWLAFASTESGRPEIFVRAVDGSGAKYPVSPEPSDVVRWAKNGRELLYGTQKGVFAVAFTPGQTPGLGPPMRLFGWDVELGEVVGLAPAPDGSRFAMLNRKPRPPLTEIRLVTNWTETLLRQR
jgi:eukaryotic-like serine/threonine-protein kinase